MSTEERKVPELRFKGFSDDWEQRKLGDISDIQTGGTPKTKIKEYWNPKEIPWMSSGEINKKRIKKTDKKISIFGHENSSARWIKKNSVLVALAGQGKTRGLVAVNEINLTTNQSIAAIIPTESLYFEFLFHNLEKRYEELRSISSGDGTRGGLNKQLVSNLLIKLPAYDEQVKIGEILKKVDILINLHQRKFNIIQSLRKFIISLTTRVLELPYPEMRFKNFNSEWELHKINEIFTITRGKVLSANLINNTKNEEYMYPVYSSQTKNNGLMGYFDSYLFEDAITWTTDGANAGTVNYRPGKFYSTNVNGVLLSQKGYSNKCIAEILDKVAWKYVSKVGNPKLMNNTMSNIYIHIPSSFKEQLRLSELFMVLDNYIALNRKKIDQLNELKKAYLRKMFL